MKDDRPTLLIVDDQPITLRALADCLQADYQIKVATNGPDALALARLAPIPDLILLDLVMPEMDGYAVCAALKLETATAAIPVIVITARADAQSETRALAAGAADFIAKPISPAVVSARVQLQHELAQHRSHLEELVHARTLELAQARDAAEAANRAKSAFLANMTHEMHTPLNHVIGLAYLLRSEITTDRGREFLATIDRAGHHLLDLVNDILDLSRIEGGEVRIETRAFDLPELLQEAAADAQEQVQAKGLTLVREIDPALPATLHGDPGHLRQVLGQLLSNAVKFSAQGCINLRARSLQSQAERVTVRFEVQDQGIGVTPEVQSGLFALFNQGDNSFTRRYGGTGLGLALCRRLVTLMGGEIDLVSTPGQGAIVGFMVPLGRGGEAPGTPD